MVVFRSLNVRSRRRLRLTFDRPLGALAFNISYFAVQSADGCTGDPTVLAAMAVQDAPAELELALGSDLANGGLYTLSLSEDLPAADASILGPNPDVAFSMPAEQRAPSVSFSAQDLYDLIFNVDLLHNGTRFIEAPDGDIATVSGPENVKGAAVRRALSEGLPHDEDYGGKLRQEVDAPAALLPRGRARVEDQMRLDDRVVQSIVSIGANRNDGSVTLLVNLELVGGIRTSTEARV